MARRFLPSALLAPVLLVLLLVSPARAHEACMDDADCVEEGTVCYLEACSVSCSEDADCPEGEVCVDATACVHGEEEGGGGCSVAPHRGARTGALPLALLAAGVLLAASRRRR